MRPLSSYILLALVALASAIPITPSAPEHQHLAEEFRLQGLNEHEIAEQLSTSTSISDSHTPQLPLLAQLSSKYHSIFHAKTHQHNDFSGDIAPGSLEAPQMLPRAATPESLGDYIKAVLRGEDLRKREFGYEGKELELRRPEGMRHWQ